MKDLALGDAVHSKQVHNNFTLTRKAIAPPSLRECSMPGGGLAGGPLTGRVMPRNKLPELRERVPLDSRYSRLGSKTRKAYKRQCRQPSCSTSDGPYG